MLRKISMLDIVSEQSLILIANPVKMLFRRGCLSFSSILQFIY